MKGGSGRARGQSLVEFAISGLVLVVLLAGVVDLGRAFYYSVALQGAAREAARQAGYSAQYGSTLGLVPSSVLATANTTLAGAGLSATMPNQLRCPSTATGNPPFADTDFPETPGSTYVYVCYQAPAAVGYTGYSASTQYANGEVDVIVLASYPLISGWLQAVAPHGLHLAANVHMPVQG